MLVKQGCEEPTSCTFGCKYLFTVLELMIVVYESGISINLK